ncbi:MAG TPA: hypothetical protein VFL19_04180 [Nitrospira sp.]|nr:hypothetical protein [Nitrospira sp.]
MTLLPTIWCAISGHGFGHGAQVVPILNELGRQVPGLNLILRTSVPASFFKDRLTIPWSLQPRQQDVGCIQRGPLDIDVPATWEAHRTFHTSWDKRMAAEVSALATASPALVMADTPYLAVSAANEAGIPAVVVASFTWSEVLQFFGDSSPDQRAVVEAIRRSYAGADQALRIAPGLPLSGIRKVTDIGPVAEPGVGQRNLLRSSLGIRESERLVLVGFGGIPLQTLPWDQMEEMEGFHFLVDGLERSSPRVHSLASLPFSFKTALASVDAVMTKPGYGTIVEAVALRLPVVYVRRHTFADEAPLVQFLQDHGCGYELTRENFVSGHWRPALEALFVRAPAIPPPAMTGAADASKVLLQYFQ